DDLVGHDHDGVVAHDNDEGDYDDDGLDDEHDHDDAPLPRAEVFPLTPGGWRPSRHPSRLPAAQASSWTRANAGRAVQRPSQPWAFRAPERSRPASGAQESTAAAFRSATVKALPRRYSRPASAPSSTPSGCLKRSAASSAFFGSRWSSG